MKILAGNLLDQKGIIVHGVNAKGYFNAGIAKQIRQKWPEVHNKYMSWYGGNGISLGSVQYVSVQEDLVVVNACTQINPGPDASISAIIDCFDKVLDCQYNALPVLTCRIGCGIGGLDWFAVEDQLLLLEKKYNKEITVYSNVC